MSQMQDNRLLWLRLPEGRLGDTQEDLRTTSQCQHRIPAKHNPQRQLLSTLHEVPFSARSGSVHLIR